MAAFASVSNVANVVNIANKEMSADVAVNSSSNYNSNSSSSSNAVAAFLGLDLSQNSVSQNGCDETQLRITGLDRMSSIAEQTAVQLTTLLHKSAQFEQDITRLGADMIALQSQSATLRARLSARENALVLIDPVLKQYALPASDVRTLCEGSVNSAWFQSLQILHRSEFEPETESNSIESTEATEFNESKLNSSPSAEPESELKTKTKTVSDSDSDSASASDPASSRALEDAQNLRKALVSRCLEKGKLFYVHQFKILRKPGTNAQIVQQRLVESRPLMEFIRAEQPRLASALCVAYRNTIKWYYTMLFGKYGRWLARQTVQAPDHVRLLGTVVVTHGNVLTAGTSASKYMESFSVGMRPSVLTRSFGPGSQNSQNSQGSLGSQGSQTLLESPGSSSNSLNSNKPRNVDGLLSLHTFQTSSSVSYPVEQLFKTMLITLANSFEIENEVYTNCMHEVAAQTEQSWQDVLSPTCNFYLEIAEKWVQQARYDLFGLLIVVRLLEESKLVQFVPNFVNTLSAKCWMHIVHICTAQAESIEQASLKSALKSTNAATALGPHPLTQMFSAYLSGILQLTPGKPEIEIETSVRSLCEAYELFISKLAAGNEPVLYNNYFVMLALLSDIAGPLADDLSRHFQLLVTAYMPK